MGMRYANMANAANSKCSVTFVLAPPTPIYAASDWLELWSVVLWWTAPPPPGVSVTFTARFVSTDWTFSHLFQRAGS